MNICSALLKRKQKKITAINIIELRQLLAFRSDNEHAHKRFIMFRFLF